ncbi:MAG: hypothetical protein A3G49_05335 [Candidatus Sungbacteria bacterium RIFCSPLOWO2_12_FULL_41_11]|uniref:Elp3/MiaA/NifB-like radical SAM core domain-containing protein n=1 Tax=Candidatus Sungbacteria bacterium RIFCSPLOWO2_12_FULL_41_11 TaxID=1802286 RepID=A0A1G2LSI6_9BACT|nr:MAG: hypothetical protein UV01_C0012G0018 [Parcubacteria group bacterium GW2011_GWA2_42_14]OHA14586.1 MAG: hypothetical protein A3G49_05335 [Candidatus Sungbacteria bacterium RIFCSPLOWO2_12_FULL_41_11]
MKTAEKQIFGKTYCTDNARDQTKPIETWFSSSPEGLMLFIIFYTKACRWNKCLGCNLPSLSASRTIDFRALMSQIDFVYQKPEILCKRANIRQIIVSNNGSVLDEDTFSSTALIYFVAKTNMLVPNLSVLTLETRIEYVDIEELEFLARVLKEGETPTTLEIAIGLEAYDGHIRNKVFKKGLLLSQIEQLAEKLARHNFRLKCYLMQKPVPEMTDEEAMEDIKNAIDYLDKLAMRFGIKVNMHLNPTYVATGTALEGAFKNNKYRPPYLSDVTRAVRFAKGKNLSVCIGLNDEGLAVPGGSFLREDDAKIVEILHTFNNTQNFELLEGI